MARQMNSPMSGDQPQMTTNQGQMWDTEPRWDETNYSMPQDMGAMQTGQNQWMGEQPPGWMPPQGMPGQGWQPPMMGGGASGSFEQSQRMKNPVDMETTHSPNNTSEAYQASMRSLLHRNVGYFIIATFLTGTNRMVTWQGILHTVGSDYLVIYQPDYERYISCDFYALKFVQFHNTKGTPYCASSHTWMARDT
ncbi:MAG: hypothetical protein IKM11_04270 [Oscillospiraceae bacterium]|nr:hypothetical protein [Oscillospiraceae bacterium]